MKQTFAIRHDIPGRLRLRLPELAGQQDAAGPDPLKAIAQHDGVLLVRSNPGCASLVLRYDPDTLPRKQAIGLVAEHFPSARPRQAEGSCSLSPGCDCHAGAPGSVKRELKRFAAINAVVGVTFARTTLLRWTPVLFPHRLPFPRRDELAASPQAGADR